MRLINGEALEELDKLIKEGVKVDMVLIDPPYYGIKGDDWDNQWDTFEDFVKWIETVSLKLKEVLKPNGSFYIFGDDKNIAYIQVALDKHFTLLNNLVWYKEDYHLKNMKDFRSYAPMSERILFYSVEKSKTGLELVLNDMNNFKELREYTKELQKFIGLNLKGITDKIGRKAEHFFYHSSTQWSPCTKETYKELITVFNIDKFHKFKTYEELRLEYEELRLEYEKQRRTFNFQKGIHEVITSPTIRANENTAHPTTKPTAILETLIKASTNEGDIVIDCFMGSGSTGVACKNLNREFIGIEMSEIYFNIAKNRI